MSCVFDNPAKRILEIQSNGVKSRGNKSQKSLASINVNSSEKIPDNSDGC
jgi:hypothetical protein